MPIGCKKLSANVSLAAIVSQLYPEGTQHRSLIDEADKLVNIGSNTRAIAKYDECLKIDENSAVSYRKRSRVFSKTGNYAGSILDSDRAIALDRLCPEGYLDKANALQKLGNEEGALLQYLACYSLDPQRLDVLEEIKKIVLNLLSEEIRQKSYERPKPEQNNNLEIANPGTSIPEFRKRGPKETFTLDTNHQPVSAQRRRMVISQGTLDGILREFERKIIEKFDETFHFDDTTLDECSANFGNSHEEKSIEKTYFECSLCIRVFLDPVCAPCGHEFCRECLQRSMDHNCVCPLCKREIDFRSSISLETDVVMQSLIEEKSTFLNFNERKLQHKNEIALYKETMPIFVCTTAFPTVPCPLRIFEPRYRLLIRRAREIHDNCFGITIPCPDKPFQDVGTVIRINHVHFFTDGHSVIQAVGAKRFKVLSYESQDGYNTARIQFITDDPIVGKDNINEIKALMNDVYETAKSWWNSHCKSSQCYAENLLGPLPDINNSTEENGPNWMWSILAAVPLSDSLKLRILSQTCLKKRLLILQRVLIETLQKQ